MKIRVRYFLLIMCLVLLGGYVLGCVWPFSSVTYEVTDAPIDRGQNLRNFISIFSAFFTLLAVVVALFKDEIVGCFKSVSVLCDVLCATVEESFDELPGKSDPAVTRYFNQVIFKNQGNINALDCELTVDRILFKGNSDVHSFPILSAKKTLQLSGQEKTYIPKNGGIREANLIEITTSEDPDGNKTTRVLMAGVQVPPKDGTWTVEMCLVMSNAASKHYQFDIVWDGKWHDNKNHMQISATKIEK